MLTQWLQNFHHTWLLHHLGYIHPHLKTKKNTIHMLLWQTRSNVRTVLKHEAPIQVTEI